MRRFVAIVLAIVICVSVAPGAIGEETASYTWWLCKGEDTTYYDNYAQNPVIQYFLQDTYAGKKVEIDFWQGISGSEKDNFNNMLATGDLADLIDLTYSDYSPSTLLEDGYIIDLTPYVAQYMPHYSRLLQEDAELAEFAYSIVDGEKRILFLANYSVPVAYAGYCYRRDWIVRFGAHPVTGEAFTGGFDDNGNWSDDVVFPNGTDTPLYISDWEWMFEIFSRAIKEQGISGGYCFAPYYTAAAGSGELYSGFGGGCPWWYRDENDQVVYGGTSDNLRAYLQCLNTWWNNGWLDKSFAQRSGDMYFSIDSTTVHQGKVGLWTGRTSEVGSVMDLGTEYTSGMMVYGAPQPINDVYGSEAQKNHDPDCLYQLPILSIGTALSVRAEGKELAPLFAFLDSMYEPERATVATSGFSAQMLAEMPDDAPWKQMYLKFGLDQGTWTRTEGEEGVYGYHTAGMDEFVANAMECNRILPRGNGYSLEIVWQRDPVVANAIAQWDRYPANAYIRSNVTGLLSTKDSTKKSKIDNNQRTYQAQTLPRFVMGDKGFDINNDADWANYCKVIEKYGVSKVTEMYQKALDQLAK